MANKLYEADLARYGGKVDWHRKAFHYHFRNASTPFWGLWHRLCLKRLQYKNGMEIPYNTKIGKGLYLAHPYNITINPAAVIGENCNIHRGVLIGQENRGHREGAPVIGDKVWIGINAAVVGKVTVGDDVLIAPNTYVNCDVPSHSIVFGNPCIIKSRENATEEYINRTV